MTDYETAVAFLKHYHRLNINNKNKSFCKPDGEVRENGPWVDCLDCEVAHTCDHSEDRSAGKSPKLSTSEYEKILKEYPEYFI